MAEPVTRWADLWDPRYTGRVALRDQPREILALSLLALGYSLNSENPQELDRALDRLLELKQSIVLVGAETDSAVPKLLSGEVAILHGWESDYKTAHETNPAVSYVSPQEGTALWGDNFVINAKSLRQRTAEVFLNFLLRPDIGAEIVNETGNANANDAPRPFVKPEIRDDPVIFPPADRLRRAYFYTPLSPDGESLYRRVWERFLAGGRGVGE